MEWGGGSAECGVPVLWKSQQCSIGGGSGRSDVRVEEVNGRAENGGGDEYDE